MEGQGGSWQDRAAVGSYHTPSLNCILASSTAADLTSSSSPTSGSRVWRRLQQCCSFVRKVPASERESEGGSLKTRPWCIHLREGFVNRSVAGKLGRFNEKNISNLYQNRLDGPIACHVLVPNSRFLKTFLVEIGQVFPQPLYLVTYSQLWAGSPPVAFISHKVFIKSFCKSQFPHKFVNVFFIIAIVKDELTDLCGN